MAVNEMYYMSTAIEIFAAMVTGILLIGCLFEQHNKSTSFRLLIVILMLQIGILLTDALDWYLLCPPVRVKNWVLETLVFINYTLGCLIIALYAYCIVLHISEYCTISLWYARGVAIGCAAAMLLWIVFMSNGMYMYFDEKGEDFLGPLFWLSQAFMLLLALATVFIVLRFRKALGVKETVALMSYGALPLLSLPIQFIWWTTPLLLAMTLSLVLVYTVMHVGESRRAAEQEKLLAEKELELSESRIAIMLSQIQPHFLYNALTTIKHLCAKKDPRAEQVVASFAKYLRGNMDSLTNKNPIPFESEMMHLENYLAIERLRFPNIQYNYDIAVSDFRIPALTVQPIVENAIRYGVTQKKGGAGTITIATRSDKSAWYVTITDNGVGYDPMKTQYDGRSHIGISNTRQRIESMCGGTLFIESIPGIGTTVTITLPKEKKK